MMNSKSLILLAVASMMLSACQPSDPALTTSAPSFAPPVLSNYYDRHFPYSRAERTATQKDWEKNEISVFLKATAANGKPINDLKEKDLLVKENGVTVTKFKLNMTNEEKFKQVVEIALVVDITGTMVKFINTAKRRLHNFVTDARMKGYHTRVCVATFGDYTVEPCKVFYDNDPDNPKTEKQMEEFLTKLAQLRAFQGKDGDPGWPDLRENPLGALIDISKAPWGNDSKRFVILVTDWGFLYQPTLPGDKGEPGDKDFADRNKVPRYSDAIDAIKAANLKVFTVARTKHYEFGEHHVWDGYNTPFQGQPSIVEASGGEFYNFDDVINGKTSLDTVLQNILNRVEKTFKVSYETTENQGLNPELPLNKRNVQITSPRGSIKADAPLSTKGSGQQANNKWKLDPSAVQSNSLLVWVDGKQLDLNQYRVHDGEVTLNQPPNPRSKLRFSFYFEDPSKNFRVEPIALKGNATTENTTVLLNTIPARAEDLIFSKDADGVTVLTFAPRVLSNEDPYHIRENEGLKIFAKVESK